jgi:hypothetical protein
LGKSDLPLPANTVMKEIGPLDIPFVVFTTSFFGRCA